MKYSNTSIFGYNLPSHRDSVTNRPSLAYAGRATRRSFMTSHSNSQARAWLAVIAGRLRDGSRQATFDDGKV